MPSPNDIQNLYIAYFNRPADVAGLAYWTTGAQADFTTVQIAESFSKQPEYASIFSVLSTKQSVNALFNNLFNHDADPAGLAYWVGQIDKGSVTIGQLAIAILAGATGSDITSVASKLAAANSFTSKMAEKSSLQAAYSQSNGNAFDLTKAWLAGVTNNYSATVAIKNIDTVFTAMPDPATLSFVVKPGIANTGTSGNDNFLATDLTLKTGGTSIKGSGGTDILSVSNYDSTVKHPAVVTGVSTLNLLDSEYKYSDIADPFMNQFSIINDYRATESIYLGNVAQTVNLYNTISASVHLGASNQVVKQLSKSSGYVEISTTNTNLVGAKFELDHIRQSIHVDRTTGPFGNRLLITDAGTTSLSAAQLKNFTWVSISQAENLTLSTDTAIMISVGSGDTSITETSGAGDVVIYMGGAFTALNLNTSASHATELNLSAALGTNNVKLSGSGNVTINPDSLGSLNLTGSAGLVTINMPVYANVNNHFSVVDSTLGNIATKLTTISNFKVSNGRQVLHTGAQASSMGSINIASSDLNSLAANIANGAGTLSDNDHKAFMVYVASGNAAGKYIYEHLTGMTVNAGDIIVKLIGSTGSVVSNDLQV